MTLTEMMPTIQSLSRAEKLTLIQLLAADVACGDERAAVEPTATIWSPYDSFEGAATLLQVLDEDKVAT